MSVGYGVISYTSYNNNVAQGDRPIPYMISGLGDDAIDAAHLCSRQFAQTYINAQREAQRAKIITRYESKYGPIVKSEDGNEEKEEVKERPLVPQPDDIPLFVKWEQSLPKKDVVTGIYITFEPQTRVVTVLKMTQWKDGIIFSGSVTSETLARFYIDEVVNVIDRSKAEDFFRTVAKSRRAEEQERRKRLREAMSEPSTTATDGNKLFKDSISQYIQ